MTAHFITKDPFCVPHTEEGRELWTFYSRVGFADKDGRLWWTADIFPSDGVSIPAPLRVILGHPFRSDYIRPAALHDYYYKIWAKKYGTNDILEARQARKRVDDMFYEALIADGVHSVKAAILYRGVRVGGWHAWNNHATR